MLLFPRRSFARLYNQLKTKLRSRHQHHVDEKRRLRFSNKINLKLSEGIKASKMITKVGKLSDPPIKLRPYITASGAGVEKSLRQQINHAALDPSIEKYRQQIEYSMRQIDESRESVRNKLLAYETEEYERKLLLDAEAERRAKIKPLTIQQRVSVNDVLNFGAQDSNDMLPSLPGTTELISHKGVVAPVVKGTVHFSDYTRDQLRSYICYNLQTVEDGLQLYIGSQDSETFDNNSQSLWLQRMAFLKPVPAWQLRKWMNRINPKQLSTKNLTDTFFAISLLPEHRPKVVHNFMLEGMARIDEMNSMNLAYFAEGFRRLELENSTVIEAIAERTEQFLSTSNHTKVTPYYKNDLINAQHSAFEGYTNWTIPQFNIPADAIQKLTRLFVEYGVHTDLVLRLSGILECILYEVDLNMLLQLLKTLSKVPGTEEWLVSLMTIIPEQLDLMQMGVVINSLLDRGLYNYSNVYEPVEVLAVGLIFSSDAYPILRGYVRYWHYRTYGEDIIMDKPRPVTSPVLVKIKENWNDLSFSKPEEAAILRRFIK